MLHLSVSNSEFFGLGVGDPVDHMRRTAGSDIVDELYPTTYFDSATLRREAAPENVEYMGRWRIAGIQAEATSGGERRAIVDIEPF